MTKHLRWQVLYAPWNRSANKWVCDIGRPVSSVLGQDLGFQVQFVNVSEYPELDSFLQNLATSVAPTHQGWPLNFFSDLDSGRPLMICGALDRESLARFLKDLRVAFDESPEVLFGEADFYFKKMETSFPSATRLTLDKPIDGKIVQGWLNPLIQSLDPDDGSFSRPWSFCFPWAYRALDDVPTDGVSLGVMGFTQFLKSEQWDPIEGCFFRAVSSSLGEFEPEKNLLENLEFLDVSAHFLKTSGAQSEFIRDCFFEGYKSLIDNFHPGFDADAPFVECLERPKNYWILEARDLLEALPGDQRRAAQKFFGVSATPHLPKLGSTVLDLSRELNLEPTEVRNLLLKARSELARMRSLRIEAQPTSSSECVTLTERTSALAIYRLLRIGAQVNNFPLPVEHKSWMRETLRRWVDKSEASLEKILALRAYFLFSDSVGLVKSQDEILKLKKFFANLAPLTLADATVAANLPQGMEKSRKYFSGIAAFDHLGVSRLGLVFEARQIGIPTDIPDVLMFPKELGFLGVRGMGATRFVLAALAKTGNIQIDPNTL